MNRTGRSASAAARIGAGAPQGIVGDAPAGIELDHTTIVEHLLDAACGPLGNASSKKMREIRRLATLRSYTSRADTVPISMASGKSPHQQGDRSFSSLTVSPNREYKLDRSVNLRRLWDG